VKTNLYVYIQVALNIE